MENIYIFLMGNVLLIGVDVGKPNGILHLPKGKISKWRMCQSHSCFLLLLGQWIKLDKFKLSSKPLFLKERSQISLHLFPSALWESPWKLCLLRMGGHCFKALDSYFELVQSSCEKWSLFGERTQTQNTCSRHFSGEKSPSTGKKWTLLGNRD